MTTEIGVISDTHGLLRPEARAALQGCTRIIHAGDVGDERIIGELERIAPTAAIRGNVDRGPWADALPHELELSVAGVKIHVVHDLKELSFPPSARGIGLVISGHSHKPSFGERNGVWYLNPGAAGKRRFSLPITLARVQIAAGIVRADLIDLSQSRAGLPGRVR